MDENKDKNGDTTEEDKIEKTGSVDAGGIHCLTIIGQIEGHFDIGQGQKTTKYEHILPMLVSVERDEKTKGLLAVLNTMGGDVEAGLAIAEMIASMKKPTAALILGGSHSIGVPIAVSAKRSFIVPSATMTIHPVRISGTVLGTPESYVYFNRMQERIINFVVHHSAMPEEVFRDYLYRTNELAADTGSVLDGGEAVGSGLISEVGGLKEALAWLDGQS